ncbi:hypothetical protein V6N13_019928 [Hibiscus sabdariffa]
MVNSPRFQYSGIEVSFFDMCHIDSMSMLEMYDIKEELGYGGQKIQLGQKKPKPISTKSSDDVTDEDSYYVVDSRFEDSENDDSDEEGFAHEVHVQMGSEMDMNNLNNDLLGDCPVVTLGDEEVNDGS